MSAAAAWILFFAGAAFLVNMGILAWVLYGDAKQRAADEHEDHYV